MLTLRYPALPAAHARADDRAADYYTVLLHFGSDIFSLLQGTGVSAPGGGYDHRRDCQWSPD